MTRRFTLHARADLLTIASYTREKWSPKQADHYLTLIEQRCADLRRGDPFARVFEPVPRYHHVNVAKHVVFYRLKADEIVVVRILHGSMQHERHLTAQPDE